MTGAKGNTFENELMLMLFNNIAITGIGDAGGLLGSAVDGSLYISLHTADPGETGSFDNEVENGVNYDGYLRRAVPRNASNWTVSNHIAQNTNDITFPLCFGSNGGAVITHAAITTHISLDQIILYRFELPTPITIVAGQSIPKIEAGNLVITEF